MTCIVEFVVHIVYSQILLNWHMTKPLRLQILTTNDRRSGMSCKYVQSCHNVSGLDQHNHVHTQYDISEGWTCSQYIVRPCIG